MRNREVIYFSLITLPSLLLSLSRSRRILESSLKKLLIFFELPRLFCASVTWHMLFSKPVVASLFSVLKNPP